MNKDMVSRNRNAEIISSAVKNAKFMAIDAVASDGTPFRLTFAKPSVSLLSGIADVLRDTM